MATVTNVETALLTAPSNQKNGPARACFSVRRLTTEGQTFATALANTAARPEVRAELETAREQGFMVAGAPFGPAEFAALTGL
jgi:hypothetical protein